MYLLWPRLRRLRRLVKKLHRPSINRARHNFSNVEFSELPLGIISMSGTVAHSSHFYRTPVRCTVVTSAMQVPGLPLIIGRKEKFFLSSFLSRGTRGYARSHIHRWKSRFRSRLWIVMCAIESRSRTGSDRRTATCIRVSVSKSRVKCTLLVLLPELRGLIYYLFYYFLHSHCHAEIHPFY